MKGMVHLLTKRLANWLTSVVARSDFILSMQKVAGKKLLAAVDDDTWVVLDSLVWARWVR